MKQIKYFSLPIIVLLLSLLHQSCIEELDLQINGSSDTFVIDAMLVHPDSTHYVKISLANDTPIDINTKFSVKLTDDKGEVRTFKDTNEFFDEINDFDKDIHHYKDEFFYESARKDHYINKLDSVLGFAPENRLIYENSQEGTSKIFFISNYKLEVGRKYTLSVTIDGKEYSATEKLLPQITITKVRYEKIKWFKSVGEGYHTLKIPVFSLINSSEESKYFIVSLDRKLNSLYNSSIRLFSTENMGDTIKELQFSQYYFDPTYAPGFEVGSGGSDDWYIDETTGGGDPRRYGFYPISKANYDYYKTIEKQIKTDGGIYSPNAATPISNFTGGKIYGQFIVTSESYIYDKAGYDLK
ncbi:MAG: DUF4249 family protein [Bacteroidales bacterium]|nr:DUF4249 family protein [Bacteroidales bacterium]